MCVFQTVLLVDDDEISNFLTQRIFQKGRYCSEFLIGKNGEEGIQILMNRISAGLRLPDLILIDLNMPVIAGPEFLAYLMKNQFPFKKCRFVVVSNIIRDDVKANLYALGVCGFITKPLTHEKINLLIESNPGP